MKYYQSFFKIIVKFLHNLFSFFTDNQIFQNYSKIPRKIFNTILFSFSKIIPLYIISKNFLNFHYFPKIIQFFFQFFKLFLENNFLLDSGVGGHLCNLLTSKSTFPQSQIQTSIFRKIYSVFTYLFS